MTPARSALVDQYYIPPQKNEEKLSLTLAATILRPIPLCFFKVTVTISGSFRIGCGERRQVSLLVKSTVSSALGPNCFWELRLVALPRAN